MQLMIIIYSIQDLANLSSYISNKYISSPNTPGLRNLQLRGNNIEKLIKKNIKKEIKLKVLIKNLFN